MKKGWVTLLFLFLLLVVGCKKNPPTRAVFLKSFDVNVSACVDAMLNSGFEDSIKAKELCACMLEGLYELDSTFVFMDAKQVSELVKENFEELMQRCEPADL